MNEGTDSFRRKTFSGRKTSVENYFASLAGQHEDFWCGTNEGTSEKIIICPYFWQIMLLLNVIYLLSLDREDTLQPLCNQQWSSCAGCCGRTSWTGLGRTRGSITTTGERETAEESCPSQTEVSRGVDLDRNGSKVHEMNIWRNNIFIVTAVLLCFTKGSLRKFFHNLQSWDKLIKR